MHALDDDLVAIADIVVLRRIDLLRQNGRAVLHTAGNVQYKHDVGRRDVPALIRLQRNAAASVRQRFGGLFAEEAVYPVRSRDREGRRQQQRRQQQRKKSFAELYRHEMSLSFI